MNKHILRIITFLLVTCLVGETVSPAGAAAWENRTFPQPVLSVFQDQAFMPMARWVHAVFPWLSRKGRHQLFTETRLKRQPSVDHITMEGPRDSWPTAPDVLAVLSCTTSIFSLPPGVTALLTAGGVVALGMTLNSMWKKDLPPIYTVAMIMPHALTLPAGRESSSETAMIRPAQAQVVHLREMYLNDLSEEQRHILNESIGGWTPLANMFLNQNLFGFLIYSLEEGPSILVKGTMMSNGTPSYHLIHFDYVPLDPEDPAWVERSPTLFAAIQKHYDRVRVRFHRVEHPGFTWTMNPLGPGRMRIAIQFKPSTGGDRAGTDPTPKGSKRERALFPWDREHSGASDPFYRGHRVRFASGEDPLERISGLPIPRQDSETSSRWSVRFLKIVIREIRLLRWNRWIKTLPEDMINVEAISAGTQPFEYLPWSQRPAKSPLHPGYQWVNEHLSREPSAHGLILDIGGGEGMGVATVAAGQVMEPWFIDARPILFGLDPVTGRLIKAAGMANGLIGPAERIFPFMREERFDVIILVRTLGIAAGRDNNATYGIPAINPSYVLAQANRLLKPGGQLLIWDYADDLRGARINLSDIVTQAGFERVASEFIRPDNSYTAQRLVARKPLRPVNLRTEDMDLIQNRPLTRRGMEIVHGPSLANMIQSPVLRRLLADVTAPFMFVLWGHLAIEELVIHPLAAWFYAVPIKAKSVRLRDPHVDVNIHAVRLDSSGSGFHRLALMAAAAPFTWGLFSGVALVLGGFSLHPHTLASWLWTWWAGGCVSLFALHLLTFLGDSVQRAVWVDEDLIYKTTSKKMRLQVGLGCCVAVAALNIQTGERVLIHLHPIGHLNTPITEDSLKAARLRYLNIRLKDFQGPNWRILLVRSTDENRDADYALNSFHVLQVLIKNGIQDSQIQVDTQTAYKFVTFAGSGQVDVVRFGEPNRIIGHGVYDLHAMTGENRQPNARSEKLFQTYSADIRSSDLYRFFSDRFPRFLPPAFGSKVRGPGFTQRPLILQAA